MSTVRIPIPAIGLAVVVLLSSLSAEAQQIDATITTGSEGGSYVEIGQRLQKTLNAEHQIRIQVMASSGSVQNLARLADPSSNVGLALTQTDALGHFLAGNPGFANEFIVLGDVGKECVVLIAGQKSTVRQLSDLAGATTAEISVDALGSGASVTLGYLKAMAPSLAQTRPVYVDAMEALLQIQVAGQHTHLKAVMLVQRPSARSAPVQILREKPDDYHLIPITPADVRSDKLPDGSGVYTFEKVNIGDTTGARRLSVDTVCTRGLLLASKRKLSREFRSRLSRAMLESGDKIIDPGK